jgi:hypothetical protein
MKLKPYIILKDTLVGETAFVVGAGTSLFELMQHPKFNDIHKHVVISVNSSCILMPWDKGDPARRFWISNDALCRWWSYWPKLKETVATKVIRDSWEKYEDEIPDFLYFWPRKTSEGIINPEDDGLAYCSSVPSAIDLAIFMGCKEIYLLGVDHYMEGTMSHFWQKMPKALQPVRKDNGLASIKVQKEAFNYNNIAFPALNDYANLKGVDIWNCSQNSTVFAFYKMDFSSAIDRANNVDTGRLIS